MCSEAEPSFPMPGCNHSVCVLCCKDFPNLLPLRDMLMAEGNSPGMDSHAARRANSYATTPTTPTTPTTSRRIKTDTSALSDEAEAFVPFQIDGLQFTQECQQLTQFLLGTPCPLCAALETSSGGSQTSDARENAAPAPFPHRSIPTVPIEPVIPPPKQAPCTGAPCRTCKAPSSVECNNCGAISYCSVACSVRHGGECGCEYTVTMECIGPPDGSCLDTYTVRRNTSRTTPRTPVDSAVMCYLNAQNIAELLPAANYGQATRRALAAPAATHAATQPCNRGSGAKDDVWRCSRKLSFRVYVRCVLPCCRAFMLRFCACPLGLWALHIQRRHSVYMCVCVLTLAPGECVVLGVLR